MSSIYNMKLTIGIICNVIALQAVAALALATPEVQVKPVFQPRNITALQEECGNLGVMPVPEGADPSKYRHCLRHPSGHDLGPTEPNSFDGTQGLSRREDSPANVLGKRACWKGRSYGCSSGNSQDKWFCWKRCGSDYNAGQWCWLAADRGNGPWLTCSVDDQCDERIIQNIGCGGACSC